MNDIVTSKTFQERMFEKIRDQMGDLMTEDDLKALVNSAMQKAFFEPQRTIGSYGRETIEDPVFVKMIRNELNVKVGEAIREWLISHPDEVKRVIDEVIGKGMLGLIQRYIESAVSAPLYQFAEQLRAKGVLG